jgi:hypothetical protein
MVNEEDLPDLLQLLEFNPDVETYTVIDTDLDTLYPADLGIYQIQEDQFLKFKPYTEFYNVNFESVH